METTFKYIKKVKKTDIFTDSVKKLIPSESYEALMGIIRDMDLEIMNFESSI